MVIKKARRADSMVTRINKGVSKPRRGDSINVSSQSFLYNAAPPELVALFVLS